MLASGEVGNFYEAPRMVSGLSFSILKNGFRRKAFIRLLSRGGSLERFSLACVYHRLRSLMLNNLPICFKYTLQLEFAV